MLDHLFNFSNRSLNWG